MKDVIQELNNLKAQANRLHKKANLQNRNKAKELGQGLAAIIDAIIAEAEKQEPQNLPN